MKIVPLLILVLISGILSGQQQSEQKVNQISVQGSVELREPADQATLSFSVKGVGPSLRQAVQKANERTKVIVDKLISLGIKERNISTSSFFSGENYGDKAFLSSSRDFKADISTIIKIDSLALLEPVILAISESEVESISKIDFSLKDEAGFRKRARIAAVMKAKEKAEDMANVLGINLGKVILIDEFQPTETTTRKNYPNPFNPVYNNTVLMAGVVVTSEASGVSSGFFAQTVSITSVVYITFELK